MKKILLLSVLIALALQPALSNADKLKGIAGFESDVNQNVPWYNTWTAWDENGTSGMWSSANYTTAASFGKPALVRLKCSEQHPYCIMAALTDCDAAGQGCNIKAQVWDGAAWGTVKTVKTNIFVRNKPNRGRLFDVVWQRNGDGFVITGSSVGDTTYSPWYMRWSLATHNWTSASAVQMPTKTPNGLHGIPCGAPAFIEAATSPTTSTILMAYQDYFGTAPAGSGRMNYCAYQWDGSSWAISYDSNYTNQMPLWINSVYGSAWLESTVGYIKRMCLVFEQASGRGFVAFESVNDDGLMEGPGSYYSAHWDPQIEQWEWRVDWFGQTDQQWLSWMDCATLPGTNFVEVVGAMVPNNVSESDAWVALWDGDAIDTDGKQGKWWIPASYDHINNMIANGEYPDWWYRDVVGMIGRYGYNNNARTVQAVFPMEKNFQNEPTDDQAPYTSYCTEATCVTHNWNIPTAPVSTSCGSGNGFADSVKFYQNKFSQNPSGLPHAAMLLYSTSQSGQPICANYLSGNTGWTFSTSLSSASDRVDDDWTPFDFSFFKDDNPSGISYLAMLPQEPDTPITHRATATDDGRLKEQRFSWTANLTVNPDCNSVSSYASDAWSNIPGSPWSPVDVTTVKTPPGICEGKTIRYSFNVKDNIGQEYGHLTKSGSYTIKNVAPAFSELKVNGDTTPPFTVNLNDAVCIEVKITDKGAGLKLLADGGITSTIKYADNSEISDVIAENKKCDNSTVTSYYTFKFTATKEQQISFTLFARDKVVTPSVPNGNLGSTSGVINVNNPQPSCVIYPIGSTTQDPNDPHPEDCGDLFSVVCKNSNGDSVDCPETFDWLITALGVGPTEPLAAFNKLSEINGGAPPLYSKTSAPPVTVWYLGYNPAVKSVLTVDPYVFNDPVAGLSTVTCPQYVLDTKDCADPTECVLTTEDETPPLKSADVSAYPLLIFFPNTDTDITATCFNFQGAKTLCPGFCWSPRNSMGQSPQLYFNPYTTDAQASKGTPPKSTFYVLNPTSLPQSGDLEVLEKGLSLSCDIGFMHLPGELSCTRPFEVHNYSEIKCSVVRNFTGSEPLQNGALVSPTSGQNTYPYEIKCMMPSTTIGEEIPCPDAVSWNWNINPTISEVSFANNPTTVVTNNLLVQSGITNSTPILLGATGTYPGGTTLCTVLSEVIVPESLAPTPTPTATPTVTPTVTPGGDGIELDCPVVVAGSTAEVTIKLWNVTTGDAVCVPDISSFNIVLGGLELASPDPFKTCSGGADFPDGSGRHAVTFYDGNDPAFQSNTLHTHDITVGYGGVEKSCVITFSPQPKQAPDLNVLLVLLVGVAAAFAIRFKKK